MIPVVPRQIITDALILGGRWHLAGTTIAIGEVRLDHAARGGHAGYRYRGLSADEVAACLAFGFPAIRESSVAMLAGTIVVSCACGEDTSSTSGLAEPVRCVCGRVWRLRLLADLLHEGGVPANQRLTTVAVAAAP